MPADDERRAVLASRAPGGLTVLRPVDPHERSQALSDLLELLRIRCAALELLDEQVDELEAETWSRATLLEELRRVPGVAGADVLGDPPRAAVAELEPRHDGPPLRGLVRELCGLVGVPVAFGRLRRPAPVSVTELEGEIAEVTTPGSRRLRVPSDQAGQVSRWLSRLPDPAATLGIGAPLDCVVVRQGAAYALLRVIPCEVCGERRHHGMPHARREGSSLLGQCSGGTSPTFQDRLIARMEADE